MAVLPKGAHKSGRRMPDPYNSESNGKIKYPSHISNTVKKSSNKIQLAKKGGNNCKSI